MTTATESLINAHQNGTLLAHMLENKHGIASSKFNDLMGVLAGKEGANYKHGMRDVTATPEGYRGLATTALKACKPVKLWTIESGVGFLFDTSDQQHVKPFMVNSGDIQSEVSGNIMTYHSDPEHKEFAAMSKMQKKPAATPEREKLIMRLDNPDQMQQRIEAARKALPEFWKALDRIGSWSEYTNIQPHGLSSVGTRGINEVDAIVHLRGIKGIIVSKAVHDSRENGPLGYTRRVMEADRMRDYMMEHYREYLPKDLPILVYDPLAKEQLQPVTAQKGAQYNTRGYER